MPVQVADHAPSSQVRGRTSSTAEGGVGNHALSGSSPFKRQKVDHASAAAATTTTVAPSSSTSVRPPPQTPPRKQANAASSAMYSFSSGKNGMVIDLTESPGSSQASTPGGKGGMSSSSIGSNGNGLSRAANFRAPNGAPKQFVIKNLRPVRALNAQEQFAHAWKRLDQALEAIFDRNERPTLLEELYKSVETVCKAEQAKELFAKLHYRCRDYVKGAKLAGRLEGLVASKSRKDLLAEAVRTWHTWQRQMEMVKLVFLYLNQSYLVVSKTDPTIDELRVSLFRNHVFSNAKLKDPITTGACELVLDDVEQRGMDRKLFGDAVDMFHALKVYTKSFEPRFLATTQEHYLSWSNRQVKELGLPSFVKAAQDAFAREKARCDEFGLDESTERDVQKQLKTFLVDDRIDYLTKPADVGYLLETDEEESLTSLFNLLQRRGHGAKLRAAFAQFVEKTGEAIVFDEKGEQEMIPRLLALKRKMDQVLLTCFQREDDLGIGMREAFRAFMNKTKKTKMTHGTDNEKTGEMIAKYVDALLRGGLKAVADDADGNEEVDDEVKMKQQLDQVLELFRFLNGKAVFEAFYKRDLARRLLHKSSASDWAEKEMLQRLKDECGEAFTSNLNSMFRDVETSKEENAGFKSRQRDRAHKGPELEVNVLESAAWPSYSEASIIIPPEVESTISSFTNYYKQRFPSRKLEWKHAHAHCQLDARFDKNYVVVVSAMQAAVLLYFNDVPDKRPVGVRELQEALKLEEKHLVRTLQSLACARYRVLKKSSKGPDVAPDSDTFTVQTRFRTDKVRFKINQIQLKETKEENKETHERVAADREFETQAAIVRIMKARQKITHTELITKVIEALAKRGNVSVEDVKKQIDKLIDKEYMERLDDKTYEYMA